MSCRNHALVKIIPFIFAPLTLTLSSGESVSAAPPQKHTRVADVIDGHVHPSYLCNPVRNDNSGLP